MEFTKKIPTENGYYYAKRAEKIFIVEFYNHKVYFTGIGVGVTGCVFEKDGGLFGKKVEMPIN